MTGRLSDAERAAAGLTAPSALTTGIVDLHFADGVYDLAAFKAAGGVAVIHKATEGGDFDDKGDTSAMQRCKAAGLLQGLYHFGNGRPGRLQAENFLSKHAEWPHALPVLDIESNARSTMGTMTVGAAVEFIQTVVEKIGRHPVFYTYDSFLRGLMARASAEQRRVIGLCPLWIAKYGPAPRALPEPFAPDRWALWQYTSSLDNGPADKVRYPRGVPGFKRASQDRSCFRGTADELAVWWKTCGLP